jgi:hypothetical protein
VFFNHFMGNLDDHDPAISDPFAADREVILFNNAGVASSTGTVPDSVEAMARDARVSDQSVAAQRTAVAAYGAAKDPSYRHLEGLRLPVLVVNGANDIVITTINSYILRGRPPRGGHHRGGRASLLLSGPPPPPSGRQLRGPP